jgi:pimeloyl-ACP methyl ester carboxylesterase
MIWGTRENYVPEQQAQDFYAAAQRAGDDVQLTKVPGAGHFEIASPPSPAWAFVLRAIKSLLGARSEVP